MDNEILKIKILAIIRYEFHPELADLYADKIIEVFNEYQEKKLAEIEKLKTDLYKKNK